MPSLPSPPSFLDIWIAKTKNFHQHPAPKIQHLPLSLFAPTLSLCMLSCFPASVLYDSMRCSPDYSRTRHENVSTCQAGYNSHPRNPCLSGSTVSTLCHHHHIFPQTNFHDSTRGFFSPPLSSRTSDTVSLTLFYTIHTSPISEWSSL